MTNTNNTTTNIQRLKMEIKGIDLPNEELIIYLQENDLLHEDEYNPESNTNKKQIYQTALSILESIANDPQQMKNYKTEDLTITHYHTNLMKRIDALQSKIRQMIDDDFVSENDTKFIYLFDN